MARLSRLFPLVVLLSACGGGEETPPGFVGNPGGAAGAGGATGGSAGASGAAGSTGGAATGGAAGAGTGGAAATGGGGTGGLTTGGTSGTGGGSGGGGGTGGGATGGAAGTGGGGTGGTGGTAGTGGGASGGTSGTGGAATGGTSGTGGAATGGTSGTGGTATGGTSGTGGTGSIVDLDLDGLDDAREAAAALDYFPFYSLATDDACSRHGVVYRVTPHPADATKWMIWYIVLFENDCGLNGHVGDDEGMGVVIDPTRPAPGGILAIKTASHQGTLCERINTCGTLPGCTPCATGTRLGATYPMVFTSKNKHGNYTSEASCDGNFICDGLDGCRVNPTPSAPPMVNAGEPGAPLVRNLTTQGFITGANGWTESAVMNFDPWGGTEFGSAGVVTDDLTDTAFIVAPGGC